MVFDKSNEKDPFQYIDMHNACKFWRADIQNFLLLSYLKKRSSWGDNCASKSTEHSQLWGHRNRYECRYLVRLTSSLFLAESWVLGWSFWHGFVWRRHAGVTIVIFEPWTGGYYWTMPIPYLITSRLYKWKWSYWITSEHSQHGSNDVNTNFLINIR